MCWQRFWPFPAWARRGWFHSEFPVPLGEGQGEGWRPSVTRTFLLARHGESEWNAAGIYQGRLESNLTELGLRQTEALAERLSARPLAAVYTSPLLRAFRTAEIVAKRHDLMPIGRPELADVDHGEWSGQPRETVAERWPELYRQWHDSPAKVRFPGGESLLQVRERALSFLAWVRQEHADGNILVITHGEVLQLLIGHFLEMDPDQLWTLPRDNCALSIVDDYEIPLIMAINDNCHLEGVRSSVHQQVR